VDACKHRCKIDAINIAKKSVFPTINSDSAILPITAQWPHYVGKYGMQSADCLKKKSSKIDRYNFEAFLLRF
jgi:hypothetical protein